MSTKEFILLDGTTSQYTFNVLATDYQWVSTGQCRQSLCVLSACGILSFCHISLFSFFTYIKACRCLCSVYILSLSVPICIYINDLPLHIPSSSAECHMLADDTTLYTTGKSVVQIQKTLQLCLDCISVWCNVNHMLINPVKTKSVIITTRQSTSSQTCHWDCHWMLRILKV